MVRAHEIPERKRRLAEKLRSPLVFEHQQLALNGSDRRLGDVAKTLCRFTDRGERVLLARRFLAGVRDDRIQQRTKVLHVEQQQSFVEFGRVDLRCREAVPAQRARHRDERLHVFGEMRDRAVGQAIAHRRAVGPARRVHQDHVLVRVVLETFEDAGPFARQHLAVKLQRPELGQGPGQVFERVDPL